MEVKNGGKGVKMRCGRSQTKWREMEETGGGAVEASVEANAVKMEVQAGRWKES